ncbi:HAD family hydrolase [Krasilnikovia sp. MM14-A1259]|uniref:HAD family hydrolase n=1 Tax=Krasilnikovia sp. MM14-A1259 TaxID=3373539 RepID=UPI0038272A15
MSPPRLIVDFDGVVCDALVECALVTWLGAHPPAPDVPVSSYAIAMPDGFVRRFAKVRDYARTLHHFLVAHRAAADRLTTQAQFDALYGVIPAATVRSFVAAATAARQRCRVEETAYWLDLHALYPGVEDLLLRHAGAVAVITAKDADSVWTILRRRGLDHTVGEVIGECSRKDEAVAELCARTGTTPQQTVFIDDNLTNVRRVARTGARTYWATWGYHTPEDVAAAAGARVRPLTLAGLPTLNV